MSNMDERTHSLPDPAALVKIGVYVVEPTFFKIYDVSGLVGGIVDEVLCSLVGLFFNIAYCRITSPSGRVLFPQGRLRGRWVNWMTNMLSLVEPDTRLSELSPRPDIDDQALTILVPLQDNPAMLNSIKIRTKNAALVEKRETGAYHILPAIAQYSLLIPTAESRLDDLEKGFEDLLSRMNKSQAVGLFFLTLIQHLINRECSGESGPRSAESGTRSAESGTRSAESGPRSAESGPRSTESAPF